ncbi:MAG: LLM class flavin-dependent oxidoreductase [Pseudomonadota bacterium]
MKIGNFLFPGAMTPEDDQRVIDETLREAQLCDRLGMDMVWLAEHHFDGICAYVDPVSFAAAIASSTKQIGIGFAVAQLSLHHPIRLAEQMSLIDNLSKGRLLVGLGRGTAYNIYDYQGYDIDPDEAFERLLEAEELMIKAWTTPDLVHEGKYWNVRLPELRPRPFTQPHPHIIRACSGETSTLEMAADGRPFLMNVQSNAVTADRFRKYRETMLGAGFSTSAIDENVADSWVWRNIYVTDSDATAREVALPAFEEQIAFRRAMRDRIYAEQGVRLVDEKTKAAHTAPEHAVICGTPDTVIAELETIAETGVGGLIAQFRLGQMSYEQTARSLELFMTHVAPRFKHVNTGARGAA